MYLFQGNIQKQRPDHKSISSLFESIIYITCRFLMTYKFEIMDVYLCIKKYGCKYLDFEF